MQIISVLAATFEHGIGGTIVYSLIGIFMVFLAIKLIDLIFPGVLKHQIAEDRNLALGVITGATILGICIIVAAAITS